ncbi:MAG: hypothetical protein COA33_003305 [Fluviicola sp.]|nr:hypothetical protein [Fluviicola sp.]
MLKFFLLGFLCLTFFSIYSQDNEIKVSEKSLAIEKYNLELQQCIPCNDSIRIMTLLSNARDFMTSEEYSSAYYSLEMALKKSIAVKSKEFEMLSYVSLAEFFRNKCDNKDAQNYIAKATKIINSDDIGERYMLNYYNRYAAILAQVGGESDSVILLSKKTIEIAEKLGKFDLKASSLNELGFQLEHFGSLNDAAKSYQESADIWEKLSNNRDASNALLNLSRLKMKMEDYDGAFIVLNKGIDLVDTNKWFTILSSLYDHKVSVYDYRGEYKSALDAHRKARWFASSAQAKRWTKQMAVIANDLELEKKENKIQEEQSKSLLIKQELNTKRTFLNGALISLLVALLSFLIILYYVVKFKRANKNLNSALSQKELLLKEVHHRVKNNMQSVSSLLEIQSSFITDKKARGAIIESQKRINSLALAHQNLYRNDAYDFILLKEYIISIGRNVCPKEIELTISMEEESFDMEKSQALGFVVNELLLNSIKHAWPKNNKNKTISLVIIKEEGKYTFNYCDNGIGVKSASEFLSSASFGITIIQSFLKRSFNTNINLVVAEGFCVNFQFKL